MVEKRRDPEEILVNEFTEESARDFREIVLRQSHVNPEKPLIIHIDSYGGNVDALAKMIETIEEIPNPIITYCSGKAMSAGAILFSCGNMRYIGRLSRIMIHEISSVSWGNVHDLKVDAEETDRMNTVFMDLLAKNCGLPGYDELRAYLKELDGSEIYLSAEEAVKFGIADFVGTPKVDVIHGYQVFVSPEKQVQIQEPPTTKKTTKKTPAKKKATTRRKTKR